jgi:hypothetical protein
MADRISKATTGHADGSVAGIYRRPGIKQMAAAPDQFRNYDLNPPTYENSRSKVAKAMRLCANSMMPWF